MEDIQQLRLDDIEMSRQEAFTLARSQDCLGRLSMRAFELMSDVVSNGPYVEHLPIDIASLNRERARTMNCDANRDDNLRATMYNMCAALCSTLESIIEKNGEKQSIAVVAVENQVDAGHLASAHDSSLVHSDSSMTSALLPAAYAGIKLEPVDDAFYQAELDHSAQDNVNLPLVDPKLDTDHMVEAENGQRDDDFYQAEPDQSAQDNGDNGDKIDQSAQDNMDLSFGDPNLDTEQTELSYDSADSSDGEDDGQESNEPLAKRLRLTTSMQTGDGGADAAHSSISTMPKSGPVPGSFDCNKCTKQFDSKKALANHKIVHSAFKCITCTRKMKSRAALYKHCKEQHPGVEMDDGEKGGRKSGAWARKCTECDVIIRYPSELEGHMRRHTGEKPFQCSQCPVAYAERGHLSAHLRRQHGAKPYECDQCGEQFERQCEMLQHKQIGHQ